MRKWAGAEPKRSSRRSAIAAAVVAASPALTTRVLPPSGVARSPIAKVATPPVLLVALGVERVECFRGRVGQVVGGGDQDRRPNRRGHQDRGGDGAGPVVFADQRHRGRPLRGSGGREDGKGHAGGVGGRVGAPDPGRVPGREGRVAELFGGLARRRLGARRSRWPAWAPGRLRWKSVLGAAAAADHGGDDEDDRDHDQRCDSLQCSGDRLAPTPLRLRRPCGLGRAAGFFSRAVCLGLGRGGCGRRLRLEAAESARRRAGTSALIGRSALTAANATWGLRLAVRLKFRRTG